MARSGDTLTITLTATEPLQAPPQLTVDGNDSTLSAQTGEVYSFTYGVAGTETEGSVDVAAMGIDAAGNNGAAMINLTLDFTGPSLSSLAIGPDPAKSGDALSITFDTNEPLGANPTVTVDGNGATYVTDDGTTYTYSYTVSGAESEAVPVTVSVTAADAAGNGGSTSGTVTFDFTSPTVSSLTVAPDPAVLADSLTITFSVDEPLAGNPTVTVDGNAATHVSDDGTDFTYSYSVNGSEVNGVNAVDVSATDPVGNTGTAANTVTLDVVLPGVVVRIPADGAVAVQVDATVSAISEEGFLIEQWLDTCFGFPPPPLNLQIADISGIATIPAAWGWTTKVAAFMVTFDNSINMLDVTTPGAGGDYTFTLGTGAEMLIYAFNDADGDNTWDPATEERVACETWIPANSGDMTGVDIWGFEVSGVVTTPLTWGAPRVGVSGVQWPTASALGVAAGGPNAYVLAVGAFGSNTLFAFDDLNANGLWDDNEPRVNALANPVDTTVGDVAGINIEIRTLSGIVTGSGIPAGWANSLVHISQGGASIYTTLADTSYAALVGPYATTSVYVFDDTNTNGVMDWAEDSYIRARNTINTTGASPFFRNIRVCSLTGTASVPASWAGESGIAISSSSRNSLLTGGGAYTLLTGRHDNQAIYIFRDTDGSGTYTGSDPSIYQQVDADMNSTCADTANLTFRTISGNAQVPVTWTSPMVYSTSSWRNTEAPAPAGDYSLFVTASATHSVWVFDDTNGNGVYDWGAEPRMVMEMNGGTQTTVDGAGNFSIEVGATPSNDLGMFNDANGNGMQDFFPVLEGQILSQMNPIDTTGGDVLGVVIDHTTISGTATPDPGWAAPRIEAQWMGLTVDAPGGAYSLDVGFEAHTLIYYNDANGNQRHDWGLEEGYEYCPGGFPTDVDTSGGPMPGIDFDVVGNPGDLCLVM